MIFDVIQCLDDTGKVLVSRFPASGEADLVLGSQLIVRESQAAVFCRDGKALDVFGPGRHTLSTQNLPLIGKLINWAAFKSKTPWKAEVYYVALQSQLGVKWGTQAPITFEDEKLGIMELRAFGVLNYRVQKPQLLLNKFVGTKRALTAPTIEGYLRDLLVTRLSTLLAETVKSVIGVAQHYDALGQAARSRLNEDFDKLGLVLEELLIQGITPPPEISAKLKKLAGKKIEVEGDIYEKRAELEMVGQQAHNLGALQAYRAADALRDAAQNPGLTGAAAGLGVGIAAGAMLPGVMQNAVASNVIPPNAPRPGAGPSGPGAPGAPGLPGGATAAASATRACASCGAPVTGRFCSECGTPVAQTPTNCPSCQAALAPGAKFCGECGQKLA
jgi:membrane protease subunit (stomatin/prohibitin family)